MSDNKRPPEPPITYEEQKKMGLIRTQQNNFVPTTIQRRNVPPAAMQQTQHTLDVAPTATQHIEMRTSATDRAKGFLLATVPLYGAFAVGMVVVAITLFSVPILSFAAFVVFWLSFVLAWLAGWIVTLLLSAEGISFYEARKKWQVIEREQSERWDYYRRLNDGDQ